MAGLEALRSMDSNEKITLVQRFLPDFQPDATPEQLACVRKLMEAAGAAGKRGRSARRGLGGP